VAIDARRWARFLALVGRGHTLRTAAHMAGVDVEAVAAFVAAGGAEADAIRAAQARAAAHHEQRVLAAMEDGGTAALKAWEEIARLRRLDLRPPDPAERDPFAALTPAVLVRASPAQAAILRQAAAARREADAVARALLGWPADHGGEDAPEGAGVDPGGEVDQGAVPGEPAGAP
jgi:hypothetical protein